MRLLHRKTAFAALLFRILLVYCINVSLLSAYAEIHFTCGKKRIPLKKSEFKHDKKLI